MKRFSWLIFACVLPLLGGPARALEIREALWGFDGRVVPGRFNPLSVLVVNASPNPFDGALALTEDGPLGSGSGAPFVQPCFLAPFAARWVQFYPFLDESDDPGGWTLRWDPRPGGSAAVPGPRLGAPARVRLVDPDDPAAARNPPGVPAGTRAFPENLFPTTAAATDALDSVVLDHAPRWEPARREAFGDWLRRGGTVHLVAGADGRFPEFAGELAALNVSADARVGAGRVVRHAAGTEMDAAAPELLAGKPVVVSNVEEPFFRQLASLTRPQVNWTLLYALAGLYLLALGPLHYLLGRRVDYRVALAAFGVGVAGFAWLFAVVGRRGYGETSRAHSLSLARAVDGGGGRWDVSGWTSVFMTRGAAYRLTHPGARETLYAAGTSDGAVPGVVQAARPGVFQVEIPLFSARPFAHRSLVTLPAGQDPGLGLSGWGKDDATGKLTRLEIAVAPGALAGCWLDGWVRCGGWFYRLELDPEQGLKLVPGESIAEGEFLAEGELRQGLYFGGLHVGRQGGPDFPALRSEAVFRAEERLLIARALGGTDRFRHFVPGPALGADEVEVFLLVRSPAAFGVSVDDVPVAEDGATLYQQRFALGGGGG